MFLVLKEFEPTFSRGGDMPQDFLSPSTRNKELEEVGESAMKASLAKGMPHGYEVGYGSFTINGRMLGHGDPIRVKQGERVLLHVLNGSATEIRSLALPGHSFQVIALDGNPVPNPARVPVLWIGTAERISAIVEMNHPGVWIMGDLDNEDRRHGMGIVVEYADRRGNAQWITPPPFKWNYARFAKASDTAATPDETFDMTFAKDNAAEEGFNRWTINGMAYPMTGETAPASFHLKEGKRYHLRMRNASDDIHPIHLHRHSFELTSLAGRPAAGILKDVVMLGGYQEAQVDFVADDPGLTLFHCHQQLHMDFGFMTLFDYVWEIGAKKSNRLKMAPGRWLKRPAAPLGLPLFAPARIIRANSPCIALDRPLSPSDALSIRYLRQIKGSEMVSTGPASSPMIKMTLFISWFYHRFSSLEHNSRATPMGPYQDRKP